MVQIKIFPVQCSKVLINAYSTSAHGTVYNKEHAMLFDKRKEYERRWNTIFQ